MKRCTLQAHNEAHSLLYMLLCSLCVTGASAFLLGQQNDQSYPTDLQSSSMMTIKGLLHEPLQSTEEDIDETDFSPPLQFLIDDLKERNRPNYFNRLEDHAELALSKKYNGPHKMLAVRTKRKRDKNIQMYPILSVFYQSISQANRHKQRQEKQQQQRQQEKAKLQAQQFAINKTIQRSNVLQALAYTESRMARPQQGQTGGNQTSEDNKRTLFVSQGWAPSGGNENHYHNQKAKDNQKGVANAKIYAFTSTHWGPLGKRSHPKSKMEHPKRQLFRLIQPQF